MTNFPFTEHAAVRMSDKCDWVTYVCYFFMFSVVTLQCNEV